ncbi:ribosomal RNA-processing protein 7-domain-containing protein [Desarmillaria ectypa]|nr:ribosomal RNA-processing protein 7-domain-containing protein [Desarmillaria ectypa]
MSTVGGFVPLPVSYSSSVIHYIYARAHEGSKKSAKQLWPVGRTLFLANIPPDATERELSLLFKPHGTVERVSFSEDAQVKDTVEESDDSESDEEGDMETEGVVAEGEDTQPKKRRRLNKTKPPQPPRVVPLPVKPLRTLRHTGQTAHVVFLDSSSLERALVPPTKPRSWPTSDEPSGLAHYLTLYDSLRPPLDAVRTYADSAMELYEFELAKAKQKSKYRKGEAIVDEDGFTLVTRGGAYGQTLGGGVAVASKKFQRSGETSSRNRKKKESKEKTEFYAFQKAEKQRNDLMKLKQNWEETKAKVEKLKASRRFKPY